MTASQSGTLHEQFCQNNFMQFFSLFGLLDKHSNEGCVDLLCFISAVILDIASASASALLTDKVAKPHHISINE